MARIRALAFVSAVMLVGLLSPAAGLGAIWS
jgi:hypothetical protein